jgi:hypothetical protein
MIPANIDHVAICHDLNEWGIKDYKIEMICGFTEGYVHHLKTGGVRQMAYQRAARLYNFWFEEKAARVCVVQFGQGMLATT